jgi:hypothetical protein
MAEFTRYKVGLHNVGSYQVAGKPYVTGGLNPAAGELIQIDFPSVTNWIVISNNSSDVTATAKVGFSKLGLNVDNYYFEVGGEGTISPRLEVKATQLFITGSSTNVSVMAGLTFIPTDTIDNPNVSTVGAYKNWTGSAGI